MFAQFEMELNPYPAGKKNEPGLQEGVPLLEKSLLP